MWIVAQIDDSTTKHTFECKDLLKIWWGGASINIVRIIKRYPWEDSSTIELRKSCHRGPCDPVYCSDLLCTPVKFWIITIKKKKILRLTGSQTHIQANYLKSACNLTYERKTGKTIIFFFFIFLVQFLNAFLKFFYAFLYHF